MFRFEYYQNFVTKHHMGNSDKLTWEQAANYAYQKDLNGKATICRIEQISPDEVAIIKRYDRKVGRLFTSFNLVSKQHYERVILNRAKKTVAIDRIDA